MTEIILETERLILRPLSYKDIEAVWEYNSDPQVIRYMYELSVKPGETFPREKTEEFLKGCDVEWAKDANDRSFYEFAIIEKSTGNFIGNICVYLEPDKKSGEFGWTLNRKFHGKGYATEAAIRMKQFSFESIKLNRIVARCDERNIPSRRVMQKLGLNLLWENGPRKYPLSGEEATECMYYLDREEK